MKHLVGNLDCERAWCGRPPLPRAVALGVAVTFIASSAATFNPGGIFGSEVYFDSLTMFVSFLFAARVLEARARQRAAQSLDGVMRRLPDAVERLDAQGQGTLVPASALAVGDRVRVQVARVDLQKRMLDFRLIGLLSSAPRPEAPARPRPGFRTPKKPDKKGKRKRS